MTSTDPNSQDNLEAAYTLAQLAHTLTPTTASAAILDDLYTLIADTHGTPAARAIRDRVVGSGAHVDAFDEPGTHVDPGA